MRILKWLLGLVVAFALVVIIGGFLLPREVVVSRSVDIEAPASTIFPHVNSLKATEAWSPWLERDPGVQLTYTGPDAGVGATLSWQSDDPQVGVGSQEIIASTENAQVDTALDFGDMGIATARFLLEEAGGVTTVSWDLTTDMGAGPVGRWMGLMMDGWVGGDYEQGLQNLKSLVEG
ncbi:MAG: SRPBCC family protein [Pseudomonadota bacterium]